MINFHKYEERYKKLRKLCNQVKSMEAQSVCSLHIIGYKISTNSQGSVLNLKLGFSHEIRIRVTPSVRVFCLKPNIICCIGMDPQKVTQFAASVRSCKPPEVYKGRGIKYRNEILRRKRGRKK